FHGLNGCSRTGCKRNGRRTGLLVAIPARPKPMRAPPSRSPGARWSTNMRPWSHRILGDIAVLEDRVTDARREYDAALAVLVHHACRGVEWILRKAYAGLARKTGESEQSEVHAGHARAIVRQLADSVFDHNLRDKLLLSPAVRELGDFR